MKIIWDERKRQINLEKHGLDFREMEEFDWNLCIIISGYPSAAGKARFLAVGYLGARLITAVCSKLGEEAISLISLRPANSTERIDFEWSKRTRH